MADLCTTSSRYPHDPDVDALVTRLDRSPKFRERWALRSVAQHQSGHKVVEHPQVGDVDLDSDTLITQGTDLGVVVYTPHPGTDARSKLDLLATVGLQQLAPQVR
ncbi:hypothetical protein [Streptomyces sp. NPDC050535]|uniref:MmyB family transcriptional regulator n=1 Tax=Streptomyces sp. NPDC050535 TaxID=3365626 RepID=UPI0037AEA09F